MIDEKEKIRLQMLRAFEPEIYKHNLKKGFYYSDSKSDNPNILKNRVVRSLQP